MAAAGRLAMTREDGRISADLIRRACHLVATGKDLSSWNLSNKQIDQVVAVFRVLGQVQDIAAQMQLDAAEIERARLIQAGRAQDLGHPEEAPTALPESDRKRLLFGIGKLDLAPAYIREIARDKFGTDNWEYLPTAQLTQLFITCKMRATARSIANRLRPAMAAQ